MAIFFMGWIFSGTGAGRRVERKVTAGRVRFEGAERFLTRAAGWGRMTGYGAQCGSGRHGAV
jgi:hypothetical protein